MRQIVGTFTHGVAYESHHILPKSQGGTNQPSNLVLLTIREHALAHLLLWKMGDANQIFAVECFWIVDPTYPLHPRKLQGFRAKNWLRRAVAYQRAHNLRLANRVKAAEIFKRNLKKVDALYVDQLLTTAGIG